MQLIKLTTILFLIFLNACASLPKPPVGDTCIVDVSSGGADCVPIPTAVAMKRVSTKDASSFVVFADMDNYICFSPSTWQSIQTYIGQLKVVARKQCSQ